MSSLSLSPSPEQAPSAKPPSESQSPQAQAQNKNPRLAYIMILCSSITWVSGFLYPNENNITPWEINLLKGYPLFIICYVVCQVKGYNIGFGSKREFWLVVARQTTFLLHDLATSAMQHKLPLPILHNINNSISIIVMIIELKLQNKSLDQAQKKATLVTLIGIVMISNFRYLQPLIRPSYSFDSDFQNYDQSTPLLTLFWSLFLFSMVMVVSVGIYLSSFINMNTFQINIYNALSLILADAVIYLFSSYHSPVQTMGKGLLLSGFVFSINQLLFAGSIIYSSNLGVTMLLGSFTIVVSYFWSIARYHEDVSIVCMFGSGFIVWGIWKVFVDV